MRTPKLLKLLTFLLILAVALSSGAAGADTLLTVKSHADPFEVAGQKQPGKDSVVKIWVGGDKMRRDEGDLTMIFRPDRNKLFLIHHPDKSYNAVDLPIDFKKLMPKGQEAIADQMIKGMELDVQVKPTQETKKINNWNARKVQVAIKSAMGMTIDTTLWVSKDVEVYRSLNKLAASMAALQPGAAQWAEKLEQIDGYPVLQESNVNALGAKFKTSEELVSVETKDAPAGAYDPPAGYSAKPFNPMTAGR